MKRLRYSYTTLASVLHYHAYREDTYQYITYEMYHYYVFQIITFPVEY